ncbi:hypothetical protein KR084_004490 [Drosophila pseudotakahashii]|nr:hypothetical protein KR084_004490 [Drosophila pseudotakahashii]
MLPISVFALIILVAYTNAIPADHAHHAGPAKHVGTSGEAIHWTTNGASTLNETRAVNTTDLPAPTIEPMVQDIAVLSVQNSTSSQEFIAAANAKETEGPAAPIVTSVEPESTTTPASTTSADLSKKH